MSRAPMAYLFESDSFPFDGPTEHVPPGRELVEYLSGCLRAGGVAAGVVLEGTASWEIAIRMDGTTFLLTVHWAPMEAPPKDRWIVQVRKAFRWKHLFRRVHDAELAPAVAAVDRALSGRVEIQNGRWLTYEEFVAVY